MKKIKALLFFGAMTTIAGTTALYAQKKMVDPVIITGYSETVKPGDTISLMYWEHMFIGEEREYRVSMKKEYVTSNGEFKFSITKPVKGGYITLSKGYYAGYYLPVTLLERYFVEPGDNIHIEISKEGVIKFGSVSAVKYRLQMNLKKSDMIPHDDKEYFARSGAQMHKDIEQLNSYRDSITPFAFDLLKAEIIGRTRYFAAEYIYGILKMTGAKDRSELMEEYKKMAWYEPGLTYEGMAYALYYLAYLKRKATIEVYLRPDEKITPYAVLRDSLSGIVKEHIVTAFFIERYKSLEKGEYWLNEALNNLQLPYCREELQKIKRREGKGAPAFDFNLTGITGKQVTLKDLSGKVLFVDFWFTGCGACKIYAKTIDSLKETYKERKDIEFVSVSIDFDKNKWLKSVKEGTYGSPGALNAYTSGMGAAHPVILHYAIAGYPFPMIIDKKGRIFRAFDLRLPVHQLREILNAALHG